MGAFCECVLVKKSCEPQRDPALSHLSYSQSVNISVSNSVNSSHTQKLLYGCVRVCVKEDDNTQTEHGGI